MLEQDAEGFWAIQKAESIIKTHAQFQKIGDVSNDFSKKHPFLLGFMMGSLLTAGILFSFRQPRSD